VLNVFGCAARIGLIGRQKAKDAALGRLMKCVSACYLVETGEPRDRQMNNVTCCSGVVDCRKYAGFVENFIVKDLTVAL